MPPLNYLNIWNTVIIMVIMPLSANSNVCVSSGLVSTDQFFSSLWIIFSCIFICLVNFLLDAGYFCILTTILELLYDIVKLLGDSLIVLKLTLSLVRWHPSSLWSRANFFSLVR